MKYRPPKFRMPWDLFVFLTITTAGFAYSIQSLLHPEKSNVGTPYFQVLTQVRATEFAANQPVSAVANLGCLEPNMVRRVTSADGTIRLKGRVCFVEGTGEVSHSQDIRVKNLANNFEGTVFFRPKDGSFTTDLVVLQSGKNHIEIGWKNPASGGIELARMEVFLK
ncbi:MAG: hypothetical protein HY537_00760 [Deltaproteobacteria bacterium]|nr:hypothetical protein [Deltaproteobacteria bacterium]